MSYQDEWATRDAALQAQGFGPSKLGPGVPAITEKSVFGTREIDDCGIEIPAGDKGGAGKDPRKKGNYGG